MDFEDDSTPSFLQMLNMGYTPPTLHPGENQGAAFHNLLRSPGIGGVPMGGKPAPTSPVPTREDLTNQTLAAPATIPGSGDLRSMVEKIFAHANEVRTPNYTPATSPVFGPADPELTKSLVPQRSIASQLPPMPDPSKALPLNDRARQILEKTPEIGARMAAGTVDPWSNPKPYTFREDWTGNMADVTADTHNIRKILDTYDQLYPGQLNAGWFKKPANYTAYQQNEGFPNTGKLPNTMKINDTLGGAMIPQAGGPSRYAQTEYPILQGPTNEAARILGISPAEAQERLWFQGGPRTGLKSPPMTIPDLLNSQYEKTGTVTGMDPVNIMRLWAKRQIPLAEVDQPDIPGMSAVG